MYQFPTLIAAFVFTSVFASHETRANILPCSPDEVMYRCTAVSDDETLDFSFLPSCYDVTFSQDSDIAFFGQYLWIDGMRVKMHGTDAHRESAIGMGSYPAGSYFYTMSFEHDSETGDVPIVLTSHDHMAMTATTYVGSCTRP